MVWWYPRNPPKMDKPQIILNSPYCKRTNPRKRFISLLHNWFNVVHLQEQFQYYVYISVHSVIFPCEKIHCMEWITICNCKVRWKMHSRQICNCNVRWKKDSMKIWYDLTWFMVLNATFNNISVISWQSALWV